MNNIIDFIKGYKFRDLLVDKNYQLYLYDQYSDHEGLSKLFNYFDKKLKEITVYLGLFMVLKSNQDIGSDDLSIQEYYSYLQYHYMNIIQVFGQSFVGNRWDEGKHWDDKSVQWDAYKSTGVLDPKKFKAIMRYLENLEQKTFDIFLFIKMCNEFCYKEKDLKIWVDNTSFIDPTQIQIYYNRENSSIRELNDIIIVLEDIMPDYIITFRKKTRGRKKQ